jgi:GNAT superfamily N-acetyltransferase
MIVEHAQFEQASASITPQQLDQILAAQSPPVTVLVADAAAGLLGFAALTFDYSLWRGTIWAHLDCLYVRAAHRGQSVGEDLFQSAQAIARANAADRMEWQTPDWNHRAAAFYRGQGAVSQGKLRFSLDLTA